MKKEFNVNREPVKFNLSEKIEPDRKDCIKRGAQIMRNYDVLPVKDVKEAVRLLKEEDSDWIEDILDLIEIHKENKQDLIIKMKRLCLAHYKEKNKIFGEKLI